MVANPGGRGGVRVCHVISADLWAGAAVQVYQTVSDLRRRDLDVSVAVFNDGVLARRLAADGITWKLFDERQLSGFAIAAGLARFIGQTDPDCLHVHAYKEHILAKVAGVLAGRRDIPIVRTFHGRRQIPSGLSVAARAKAQVVEQLERWLLSRSFLVAVSSDLETHLKGAYPDARVALVRNGIRMPDGPAHRSETRGRWSVPEEAFWVGCVARLEPVKNLPCLVRAAAALANSVPALRVSIFGTGSQEQALRALIRTLGVDRVVTLEGFDGNMPATMGAFDCFVLSSQHEGLPMSLLEAMALGIPAVCSRVGGICELVRPGETGLLFEADNDAELCSCLKSVHDSNAAARQMGRAAREFVAESYSIEMTNSRLLEVYESVVAGRRNPGSRRAE